MFFMGSRLFVCAFLFLVVLLVPGFSQSSSEIPPIYIVSDNFEGGDGSQDPSTPAGENSDWVVEGDKALMEDKYPVFNYYDKVPNVFGVTGSFVNSKKSLGFASRFKLKGYNWLDVRPKNPKKPYKGVVTTVSLWVWGAKYNYELEVHFNNQKNFYYRVPMGYINHIGWKNMVAQIPTSISLNSLEDVLYEDVGLRFVKFRLYSTPSARADRFYSFFDYYVVGMRSDRPYYDGQDIEKEVEKMFGEGGQQAGSNSNATNSNTTEATNNPPATTGQQQ